MAVVISNAQEAFDFVARYHAIDAEVPSVTFSGDLINFTAEVEGENYNSSIPADLARGLWEFQDELYRAVAFAIYGADHIRRLTAEQRADFQLVFQVSQGSTDLTAPLQAFLEKLGEGIGSMDSKHKVLTIVLVAAIMATAWGATYIVESQAEVKKEEIKANLEIEKERQKTQQFETFGKLVQQNPVAARFSKATEEGAKAIIKGASDAKEVKIGKIKFDQDEIQEVNQRAAKERAAAQLLTEDFLVIRVEFREKSSTKFWLARRDGMEFPVVILDEDFDADSLQKLLNAAQNRNPITLEVNATMIRNQIRSAQIVKVV